MDPPGLPPSPPLWLVLGGAAGAPPMVLLRLLPALLPPPELLLLLLVERLKRMRSAWPLRPCSVCVAPPPALRSMLSPRARAWEGEGDTRSAGCSSRCSSWYVSGSSCSSSGV